MNLIYYLTSLLLSAIVLVQTTTLKANELSRVRDKVGKAIQQDVRHIDIYFEDSLGGAVGVACAPDLILIEESYWNEITELQKFALIMHEIGHTFGVTHKSGYIQFFISGAVYTIPESIMFPSMHYFPEHRLSLFLYHYVMQMREEIKTGNRLNFMYIWVHTFTRERCKIMIEQGYMEEFKELYDERFKK